MLSSGKLKRSMLVPPSVPNAYPFQRSSFPREHVVFLFFSFLDRCLSLSGSLTFDISCRDLRLELNGLLQGRSCSRQVSNFFDRPHFLRKRKNKVWIRETLEKRARYRRFLDVRASRLAIVADCCLFTVAVCLFLRNSCARARACFSLFSTPSSYLCFRFPTILELQVWWDTQSRCRTRHTLGNSYA